MSDTKIEENVFSFLEKSSNDYARIKENYFSQDMYCQIIDYEIKSPIEQIFYIAFHTMAEALMTTVNPEPYYSPKDKEYKPGHGIFLKSQFKVGKYKVDFLISQNVHVPKDIYTPVIVELDGHNFHDRDKHQRSYEKARDRFLIKEGYKVLHFTGSDVVKDPYSVAFEVLEAVGANVGSEMVEYDPHNPLGIK